jgi:hypothetical protein
LLRLTRSGACAALAAGALCLSAGGAAADIAASTSGWRVTAVYGTGTDNFYVVGQSYNNSSLAIAGRNSAWSLWLSCTWPCTGAPATVVKHWNGRRWTSVPAGELDGLSPGIVAASSASDAWLFQSDPAAALHWNGASWTKRTVPAWAFVNFGLGGAYLYAADLGAGNVWVFDQADYSASRKAAYAARYHDGRWTKSYLPALPYEVTGVSRNDIWASGITKDGQGRAVLMHWNGHRWSAVDFPRRTAPGEPNGLAVTSPNSVWLSWVPAKSGAAQYVLHWTSRGWAKVNLPSGDNNLSLAGDGHGGLWATAVGPGRKQAKLFLHWTAGHWSTSHVPDAPGMQMGGVAELALIPGTRSLWAIGDLYGPSGEAGGGSILNRGAIWRYNP